MSAFQVLPSAYILNEYQLTQFLVISVIFRLVKFCDCARVLNHSKQVNIDKSRCSQKEGQCPQRRNDDVTRYRISTKEYSRFPSSAGVTPTPPYIAFAIRLEARLSGTPVLSLRWVPLLLIPISYLSNPHLQIPINPTPLQTKSTELPKKKATRKSNNPRRKGKMGGYGGRALVCFIVLSPLPLVSQNDFFSFLFSSGY